MVVVLVKVKVKGSLVRRVRIDSDHPPVWAGKFRRSAFAA
jgi:hypothetical protein